MRNSLPGVPPETFRSGLVEARVGVWARGCLRVCTRVYPGARVPRYRRTWPFVWEYVGVWTRPGVNLYVGVRACVSAALFRFCVRASPPGVPARTLACVSVV